MRDTTKINSDRDSDKDKSRGINHYQNLNPKAKPTKANTTHLIISKINN